MTSVSVPEKTLEHWASQYVTYRYRSKAALWWPSRGEDVDVRCLPTRPGKAVQLELKTTTVTSTYVHDVKVDLGQLWDYAHRPLGRQPFYIFPWPDWTGTLAQTATSNGLDVTELAFSRSGPGWWFAEWMVALTTRQVENVLTSELSAHGSSKRGTSARLVRFNLAPATQTSAVWGNNAAAPTATAWLDLWSALEQCGQPGWPQLLRVPTQPRAHGLRQARHAAVARLRSTTGVKRKPGMTWDELETLTPDSDDYFVVEEDDRPTDDADSAPDGRVAEDQAAAGADRTSNDLAEDHRVVVFLDARALSPS